MSYVVLICVRTLNVITCIDIYTDIYFIYTRTRPYTHVQIQKNMHTTVYYHTFAIDLPNADDHYYSNVICTIALCMVR